MSRQAWAARAVITGMHAFPIDMLRYDRCTPATEADSSEIAHTLMYDSYSRGRAAWVVTVIKTCATRVDAEFAFTLGRWESFGCTVSSIAISKEPR